MTEDYAKKTVGDIKNMLVEEGRYTEKELGQLEIKGKAAWVELHKQNDNEVPTDTYEWEELSQDLENIIEEGEELLAAPSHMEESPKDPDIPSYNSVEWNEYVMSLFAPEELVDGKYPNVNALRRMVGLLLGDIVYSGPIQAQVSDTDLIGKTIVTYQITIDWKHDVMREGTIDILTGYPQRVFTALGGAFEGNLDGPFRAFPEAMADTRAEVRALRRALRINTVGAEELTKKDVSAYLEQKRNEQVQQTTTTGEWEEGGVLSGAQKAGITTLCERLNIDLMKFINMGEGTYDNIESVPKAAAKGMMQQLAAYQSAGKEDSKPIPSTILK